MTGLVRKATLFTVCALLAAGAAFASVPSPTNSSCPLCFSLVGDDGLGTIDPIGEFCVEVRDLANQPINNSVVVVDLSGCSNLVLCENNEAGFTVDCQTQTVRGFTVNGLICFRIKGYANNSGGNNPPYNAYNCAKIFADGVLLCQPSVAAYDMDGNGGGPADLSAWLNDFFNGPNPSRADYDCVGGVGPADLSAWLAWFFAGGSTSNCPAAPKTATCGIIP